MKHHEDLDYIYYPNKYIHPTDFYIYDPPNRKNEFTQNVIFDPCREYEFDCCNDTYGTPEFEYVNADPTAQDYNVIRTVYDDLTPVPQAASRRPTDELYVDPSCTGEGLPLGRVDCVMERIAKRPASRMPQCWNWNATLVADADCRAPLDGTPIPLCIELGYTQNAYIVECGGEFSRDPHCGTYLEIHRPGRADKLAETRLRGVFTSGYRRTVISTTYKRHPNRVLCWDPYRKGRYELWWVQRTQYNFIVQRRMTFSIISPICDWDPENNRYLNYATLYNELGEKVARSGVESNPFDPQITLFTRERIEGTTANPGKGMGSTYVPIEPDTYPAGSRFDTERWHNFYTYIYTPEKPLYTVRSGVLEPSLLEQELLRQIIEYRGYARLLSTGRTEDAVHLVKHTRKELEMLWKEEYPSDFSNETESAAMTAHYPQTEWVPDYSPLYSLKTIREKDTHDNSVAPVDTSPLSFEERQFARRRMKIMKKLGKAAP